MAHARPDDLKHLRAQLDELRCWPRLKERSPGIFYFGAKPFLHFHTEGSRLWADVKRSAGGWSEIPATTKRDRDAFLKCAAAFYEEIAGVRLQSNRL